MKKAYIKPQVISHKLLFESDVLIGTITKQIPDPDPEMADDERIDFDLAL